MYHEANKLNWSFFKFSLKFLGCGTIMRDELEIHLLGQDNIDDHKNDNKTNIEDNPENEDDTKNEDDSKKKDNPSLTMKMTPKMIRSMK